MIDAGTISASLILDTEPFSKGMDQAFLSLAMLGVFSGEQEGNIGTLGEALAAVGGRIYTEFQSPVLEAVDTVRGACLSVTGTVMTTIDEMAKHAKEIKFRLLSPFIETVSQGRVLMYDFCQGLLDGLSARQSAIMAKARSIANSVSSTMKKALGIASPSRVMRQVGHFTAEGMVLGLQDMKGEVERASSALAQSAVSVTAVQGEISGVRRENPMRNDDFSADDRASEAGARDILYRKLDTLIELLSGSRQSIEIDRRTFGTLVREYT